MMKILKDVRSTVMMALQVRLMVVALKVKWIVETLEVVEAVERWRPWK